MAHRLLHSHKGLWPHPNEQHSMVDESDRVEALRQIAEMEQFIRNGVELGYITVPDKGDPARVTIDRVLAK